MLSAMKEEQTGNKRSPEHGCQWVPLPGEGRESLMKERKLSQSRCSIGQVEEPPPLLREHCGQKGEMQVPGTVCGSA